MGTLFPYHICIVQHQRTAQLALHRAAVSPCAWGGHAKPPGHDAHLAAGTNEQSYPLLPPWLPLHHLCLLAWFLPAINCAAALELSVLSNLSRFLQECLSGGDAGDQVVPK